MPDVTPGVGLIKTIAAGDKKLLMRARCNTALADGCTIDAFPAKRHTVNHTANHIEALAVGSSRGLTSRLQAQSSDRCQLQS